jgi:hypothetical protein
MGTNGRQIIARRFEEFNRYCNEMEKKHKEDVKAWEKAYKIYRHGFGKHPGAPPMPFTIIRTTSDFVRIIKLDLLLADEPPKRLPRYAVPSRHATLNCLSSFGRTQRSGRSFAMRG